MIDVFVTGIISGLVSITGKGYKSIKKNIAQYLHNFILRQIRVVADNY